MAHPSKRKGDRFELEVARYLSEHGQPYAERLLGAGRRADRGDTTGIPGWVLECKAEQRLDLAGWVTEAEAERANGRQRLAGVVAKRRGRGVADSYVLMTLATFARLLAEGDS